MKHTIASEILPLISRIAEDWADVPTAANFALSLVPVLKTAPIITLPDNGALLPASDIEIDLRDVRLPFPRVILEYKITIDREGQGPGTADACIICTDAEDRIVLTTLIHSAGRVVELGIFAMVGKAKLSATPVSENRLAVTGILTHQLTPLGEAYLATGHKTDFAREEEFHTGAVRALAATLTALSCKNVSLEKHAVHPSVNRHRIANKKRPFQEYHTLVIRGAKEKNPGAGGTHNSPREHVRRGHIRRLETGNIWVNACVVNPGSKSGKVDKTYALRNEAA